MRLGLLLTIAASLHHAAVQAQHHSIHDHHHHDHHKDMSSAPSSASDATPKRVAIIGAGSAGSSAAYYLSRFASTADMPVSISIFERCSQIGGRSATVNAFDDPSLEPVELGASIFVQVNRILVEAATRLGLEMQPAADAGGNVPPGYSGPGLGVWDGESFVLEQKVDGGSGWWDLAKLAWRYGLAPVWAMREMRAVVGRFLTMYEAPLFPWSDLGDALEQTDLLKVTGATGEQYLKDKGVGDRFAHEIVQASTRVNYAQNLGVIHGVETMVCLATDGAVSVKGGNWRIFHGMAHEATKDIRLNTNISSIVRKSDGTYELDSSSSSSSVFDEVIIAAPYQYSSITIDPEPEYLPEEIPYVELYVTLFTSPHGLSPTAFNRTSDAQVPLVILTTLHSSEKPGSKPSYAGKAGFFSISTLRTLTNPKTNATEFLYKIFSPEPVDAAFLARLLGVSQPLEREGEMDLPKTEISWIHRKTWHSYPVEYPRVTFERIRLDQGLWYTGGIESFISTMETSALMGMNVARLMVDSWIGKNDASTGIKEPDYAFLQNDGKQKPLKAKL